MAKKKESVEQTVRNIRRKTRKQYSSEEKIRIVLEGLRGESTVAELCRREGIAQSLYYKWSNNNQDQDNYYSVTWENKKNGETYILEQSMEPTFTSPSVVYQGSSLSWSVPSGGKLPGTYYYRAKAINEYGESDEYAQITNNGGGIVDLQGWRLNAGDPGQDFVFPSYNIQPGQSCRVYTNEYHPESCGFSFGSGTALWNNSGDCGYLYNNEGGLADEYCY